MEGLNFHKPEFRVNKVEHAAEFLKEVVGREVIVRGAAGDTWEVIVFDSREFGDEHDTPVVSRERIVPIDDNLLDLPHPYIPAIEVSDMDACLENLTKKGGELEIYVNGGGYKEGETWAFCKDPYGNRFSLTHFHDKRHHHRKH